MQRFADDGDPDVLAGLDAARAAGIEVRLHTLALQRTLADYAAAAAHDDDDDLASQVDADEDQRSSCKRDRKGCKKKALKLGP